MDTPKGFFSGFFWIISIVVSLIVLIILISSGYNIASFNVELGPVKIELEKETPTPTVEVVPPTVESPPNLLFVEAPNPNVPKITGIRDSRQEFKENEWKIYKYIDFSDKDGDAYTITYDLVKVSREVVGLGYYSDGITSIPKDQIAGTYTEVRWDCGVGEGDYFVTLRARIKDHANNISEPMNVTFICP